MPVFMEQTAYSFFGVSPRASPYEIDQAYRRQVRRYPADRIWDTPMGSVAKTVLQEVELWYALISTPEARAAYDAMLAEKDKPVLSLDGDGVDHSNGTNESVTASENGLNGETDKINEAYNGENGKSDQDSAPEADSTANDSLGEQDDTENKDADDEDDSDDDEKSTPPSTHASAPITIETLGAATANSYLYRTRTRTIITLFVIWLGILIVVYGTPSTWTLSTQVSNPGPYATLGLPDDTALTPQQIRSAYHRAVLAHHPDKRPSDENNAIVDINAAYETLRQPYQPCLYELVQWLCAHLRQAHDVDFVQETAETTTPGSLSTIQTAQVAVFHTLHSMRQRVWYVLAQWLGRMAGC